MTAAPPPPNRAVVSDDGERIALVIYGGSAEPLAVVALSLEQALRLSAQLTEVVASHLAAERNHRAGVIRGPAQ